MNLARMDRVLAAKRELHPELAGALDWDAIQRILEREGVKIYQAAMPNPAKLVRYDNSWNILIGKGSDPAGRKQWVAHELAHLWFHVDDADGRFEHCLNYTYAENADPREAEAEYLSLAILYGPKIFPRAAVPARFKEIHAQQFQPLFVKAGGTFPVKAVGTSKYQKALEKICGPRRPDGYDRKLGAVLKCEDTNSHDPNAVRVEIRSRQVGYLSRENAVKFRAAYDHREVRCPAEITGGWDRGGNWTGYFGVKLDLQLAAANG